MTNIIIGILIAWLAEWLFYTLFWKNKARNKRDNSTQQSSDDSAKAVIKLEEKIAKHEKEQKLSAAKLAESDSKIAELEANLQAKVDELKATNAEMVAAASTTVSKTEPSEADADSIASSDDNTVNNLTTIAGIGPKLHEALNDCGITSFNHLIAADMDDLLATLKEKGVRFNQGNATTWAQQATLAAQGDWSGLDALKAELKG